MKIKKKISLFFISLLLTLLLVRGFLYFFPFTNLNIGNYNLHHLYIGSFLIIITGVLLLLEMANNSVIILSGISSALILDELIYLIATDGSDLAYLSSVSFIGSLVMTAIILSAAGILYYGKMYYHTLLRGNKRGSKK